MANILTFISIEYRIIVGNKALYILYTRRICQYHFHRSKG